jgi:hydroxymethylglutaryl-CoA lyase
MTAPVPAFPAFGGDTALVTETGPTDGLQMVPLMPTEAKKKWLSLIAEAGFREIDVASFIPPSVIPQFADAEEVAVHGVSLPNASARMLVPNLKGAVRAARSGARNLSCLFSVSEAHSRSNVRRSREDQFRLVENVLDWRNELPEGERPFVQVSFSCVFGCSIQGNVEEADVVRYVEAFLEAGIDDVLLCDTVGYANPKQVRRLLTTLKSVAGDKVSSLHVHNTRGLGLANVAAAVEVGMRRFDSSLGGLGGCPFAPGATGNIVTEDLIFLLESMGLRCGIDFHRLLAARHYFAGVMPDVALYGEIAKAGLPVSFERGAADASQ